MHNVSSIALILAGGHGRRMACLRPKQFVDVDGRPVLAYTLSAFATHPGVDAVAVVCVGAWMTIADRLGRDICGSKYLGTFRGGESSVLSARNGVESLWRLGCRPEAVVLIHDGVRPLVSDRLISGCLETCQARGNAVAGLQSNEAFLVSSDGQCASSYLPRAGLFRAQTPLAFPLGTFRQAFAAAGEEGVRSAQSVFTLMAGQGLWPLHIVQGESCNFKITYPGDLELFRAFLAARQGLQTE